MNGLTLKHLRYLAALAKHGHFAKAAEACAVSQPALSLQIKQLEDLAGVPLAERTTRRVQLTATGELIAARARDILLMVEEIGDVLRASRGDLVGRFRLGMIPTIAPYLLPEVVLRLTKVFPLLDIDLRETVTPIIVQELKDGCIDAAIVALPIGEPELTELHLVSESFVLVRPSKDVEKPIPNTQALQEMKLLLLEEGHCFRSQALSFCEVRPENYRNIMNGSSLTTLVQLVASGVGVTLIPEMAARVEANMAQVCLCHFPAPQPSRDIGMIWRRTSPLEPQILALSDVIRDAAVCLQNRNMVDDGRNCRRRTSNDAD